MRVPQSRQEVLDSPVPELALGILGHVSSAGGDLRANDFVRVYFATLATTAPDGSPTFGTTSPEDDRELAQALLEGWQWLVNQGLLASMPLFGTESHFVTRAGRARLAVASTESPTSLSP